MLISQTQTELGASATPPVTPPPSQQSFALSLSQRMQKDTCFHCRQQGHWARDCPLKKSQPSTSFSNGLDLPLFRCPCGLGFCLVRVSHSDKNPGRKFFTCPGINGNKCGFFIKWCDEVTTGETSKSPPECVYPYPKCSCEAGVCKRIMLNRSPNAGRTCFVCRVPRGFGACCFLQWEDTQEITTVNDIADESKHEIYAKTTLRKRPFDIDLGDSSIENPKRMKFDSLEMESPQHFPTVAHARELFGKEQEPLMERGECDESSDKTPSKGIESSSNLQGLVMLEAESRSPIMKKSLVISHLRSPSQICRRQAEFWRQITAAGDTSTADRSNQILGLHITGWLGRLAFPPPRCLSVLLPRCFFCCVFPSFDPMFVPQDKNVSNYECFSYLPHSPLIVEFDEPSSQISGQDAQALCDVSLEMPIAKSPPAMSESSITTLNMEVLEQTVLDVQNMFLAHLESMAQEAESTFNVLDILLVNHAPFHELVKKFIVCASSLADKEKSVNQEQSLQSLIERYHSEKVRYDDISCIHAETETALTASNRHLVSLREEASCVKDLLLRIENQLSSCEAETKELETRLGKISRNMLESQKSLQAAYGEAEEALKLHQLKFCQQREQMQNAIMAGLELVRSKLRK
ncbi:uncharacterized protein LOC115976334 isoform X1 [Quercus lobata]|uniref:CCHC-type domain-containing protein n=1 Tax=Quercus lobata TaxID=97700 RepID=A0A7N2KYG0_QUELO|nr:uncharacterized protein LOC115976334 isoform X1 [Quercus lobata]